MSHRRPTAAQLDLLDAAVKHSAGHIVGGDPRARQALRDRGWAEVYGHHFGPLDRITDAGRTARDPRCACGCLRSEHACTTHRGVCLTCYGRSDHGIKDYCRRYRLPKETP